MKKTLATVLVLCVVLGAGAAFSQEAGQHRGQHGINHQELNAPNGEFQPCNFENRRPQMPPCEFARQAQKNKSRNFSPDMPKEIREKAAELAKLRVDLEEAMTARPMNKAKALEVYAKMQKLKNEINTWKFEKRLERIENLRKQRELNKKVPPAKSSQPQNAPEK